MANSVAVITGAAGGLGSAIARRLTEEFDVVVVSDVRREDAERTASQINGQTSGRAVPIVADVRDPESVMALYDAAAAQGDLKGLVNGAGIGTFTDLLDIGVEMWDQMFAVNTKGTFLMTQEFVRRAAAPAAIVNISSIGARTGGEPLAHYGASKAAVEAFSHSVARRCARQGIRSNTIMPGLIYTDMWRSTIAFLRTADPSMEGIDDETAFAGFVEQTIPMGRPQEPEDIAEAAAFLISDRARNITGQTLGVDGGAILT